MDIGDWWNRARNRDGRLKLSSRRLVVVLRNLPEDSPFKNAVRGDWPEDKYIQVGILNELRITRSDNAAFQDRELEPILLKSPAQIEKDQADTEYKTSIRSGILAQLNRK